MDITKAGSVNVEAISKLRIGSDEGLGDSSNEVAVAQKTYVSLFHELCTKFGFGMPMYDLVEESGEAHQKNFRISLTVWKLGISVVGKAKTKMQAKHDAAYKMMMLLKKTTQSGGTLNSITQDILVKCFEWMKTFEFLNEDVVQQTAETKNSAGMLTSFALTRHLNLPEYEVVSITGPSHFRQFVMTCKMYEHVTRGEGKSKKICKNIAAEQMLLLLQHQFPV
ncbi:interferon-inducible double-stranded RNA-dependent protein kinase activator A homolog [Daphnia carinata]|uniref:interferon-inducible double-stranded RNA-dependent protein kinase activator A homolog n=1 Tax=Daphnia carinata TaxID=120202 RepID=UPI00257E00A1|nr:interferon-inducible double-stranded RNA-dependent protein kinase activator A homolog [Daphnia carinata]XP_059350135.1 interferon-inducible double-stranded RNA-dependent protein kinase activator A homolog [Daphnia carinata]